MKPARSVPARAVRGSVTRTVTAMLPEEVPVALVYQGGTQAVMMATPADLEDFGRGFSLTEGLAGPEDIETLEVVEAGEGVEIRMWLTAPRAEALAARRRSMAGPVGCGLCGIDSLAEALRPLPRVTAPDLAAADVAAAMAGLRARQALHDQTRAVHAAGFFVPGQGVVLVREDVGRHNALDKLVGALVRAGIDRAGGAAVLTSRVSIDMVQKCAVAAIGAILAVSAPTAHAVRLAEVAGMLLAARCRDDGFELYAGRLAEAGESDVA